MDGLAGRLRTHAASAVVLVFAVASVVEVSVTKSVQHRPAVIVVALGWSLPFALRRRRPFAVPLLVAAAIVLLGVVAGDDAMHLATPFFGALLAAASFGQLRDLRLSLSGLAAIVGAAAVVDVAAGGRSDFVWTTIVLALAWGVGSVLGARADQARILRARVTAAERERARITHELHDVVAHSVSSMVIQASAVRRLLHDDQSRERDTLLTVEQTGRDALAEMRRMVGVMRPAEHEQASLTPQPGLKHLDALIAEIEATGVPVSFRIEGDRPELSPGVDLSAYRVVQDALAGPFGRTNGSGVRILVRYGTAALELEVAGGSPIEDLSGLRERLALYGGTLETESQPGGAVVVRARLPLGAAQ